MNEITQTNFSFVVTIPSVQCDACVLRVRYVSNNPLENDRGEIFYQCSDITITSSDRPSSTSQPPAMLVPLPPILTAAGAMSQGAAMHPVHVHNTAVQTGTPCCTPKQVRCCPTVLCGADLNGLMCSGRQASHAPS